MEKEQNINSDKIDTKDQEIKEGIENPKTQKEEKNTEEKNPEEKILELEDKLEEQAEMDKLENENGISFEGKNDYSLPRLDVRHDWEIGQIKNIRVVGKTPSGKSVDLQVTRKWSKWDNEKEQYIDEDKVEVFAKVRFDKVKRLLRNARYNELIVE